MPVLLQISIEVNSGSVGRIAEQIGETVLEEGWSSYITFARNNNPSRSQVIKIGSTLDVYLHGIETRIFDNHGFGSRKPTKELISKIEKINPDIIHLHHLHGYFINIEILFNYLKKKNIPVVWTFHDCWSFTGHCAYFDFVGCNKWKSQCFNCEQKNEYPKSILFDRSKNNFLEKKRLFNSLKNLTIVPVSHWLAEQLNESFLNKFPYEVIHNGIDLKVFCPKNNNRLVKDKYVLKNQFLILGVASTWEKRKGLSEFYKLSEILDPESYSIILVGLSKNQIKNLPKNILGIERTENVTQLADLYSAADVFLNPTFEDTFPTTNLEAIACGTPVITYKTGGSVESVTKDTGFVVDQGDINGLVDAIGKIKNMGKNFYEENCRRRAVENYDKSQKFNEYLILYKKLLGDTKT